MKAKRKSKVENSYSYNIYNPDGTVTLVRQLQRNLKLQEITELLGLENIKFAEIQINGDISWIEVEDIQHFWEGQVKPYLCKTLNPKEIKKLAKKKNRIYAKDFCYFAALWEAENLDKIIVLFMAH